ncbi:MAG: endonuclease [Planctomycetes bacterium]|nr:endonuclease [Planctomycetota bacterium]
MIRSLPAPVLGLALAICPLARAAFAQIPPGYYATVDTSSAAALRTTVHDVIDDHLRLPYTASSTDTWDVLELAWQDPSNPTRIVDVYRNRSFQKLSDRVSGYNREHTWPNSYGFPIDGTDNYPYTDCHALMLSDAGYNTARSNRLFEPCTSGCTEYPTDPNNGIGGGQGAYPGNSNWGSGNFTAGRWEVWRARRGDVARALLYLDVRYEGGVHGTTGVREPDLVLTDNRSLIVADSSRNRPLAYTGLLSTLLAWHLEDPVDAFEQRRNDVVYTYQGNRNPFIDHPEWVAICWGLRVPGSFTTFGTGCRASTGFTPGILAIGEPLIGRNLTIGASLAPASQPAVLNLDPFRRSIDLGAFGFTGCTAYALGIFEVSAATSSIGSAAVTLPVPPEQGLVGGVLIAQWVILDTAVGGLVVTDAGEIRFGRP